jgi:hypothetical protein
MPILAKTLTVAARFCLQVRADTFNRLNHTNLTGFVGTISSATFERLAVATARTMQFRVRLTF